MNTQTVLLIILAAIVALMLALFQYYYRAKNRGRLGIIFGLSSIPDLVCLLFASDQP